MISLTSKYPIDVSITVGLHPCRKMADFKRPGERNVKEEVLETRYEFHHNKRFYKLGEIANKRDEQRRLDQAKAL